ncbi:MAG: type II secretion system F family protein [Hydrogenophaga sp.]|jgi:tight adherence protein C|uniref:type II secretion system F family protein n=1 Tax=Hydrogenophaga sp. TaxID=1904254 RepID=UPI00262D63CD|nr:type II secretion system F family protein [Hydrogenophaga sp.]MDD3785749.1 type II secretion system F family protein [Hydrogenophaga sp.]MDX9969949.1 type II secretion system F family protein [Hydrogenophaga sp.]
MNPLHLSILALLLLAAALLLVAGLILRRQASRGQSARTIERALADAAVIDRDAADGSEDELALLYGDQLPSHWLNSGLGRALVADEDRKLIAQCGFPSTKAQLVLLASRCILAIALPLLAQALLGREGQAFSRTVLLYGVGFGIGFMLPKWILGNLAAKRRNKVSLELPLFVDLLGLLQSVGLSLDQSLQVVANDFRHVLPIIGTELDDANRQFSQGRTREHAFRRIAHLHGNHNLADLVTLLIQVDRHGGAVQEPIRQFSERLRLQRRMDMKARIGKITVKMTVVMVSTLLPALILVAAGPGFLAIGHAVSGMGR